MIPKIIHYCWFGGNSLPPLAEQCIASWHKHMPGWEYMRWDEASLSQALNQPNLNNVLRTATGSPIEQSSSPVKGRETNWLDYMPTYVKQAYEARKFAFVSDYVRLWALEQYGGLYMDVDFMVYRPFDELMDKYPAFAGYEGSKRQPVMQGVLASEPHGAWVRDMLSTYESREFILPDGSLDMTPNTAYFTDRLESQGFIADGVEKDVYVRSERINELGNEGDSLNIKHSTLNIFLLHVFPVHYFCPVLTTGEDVRTSETYCEHKGESSWAVNKSWKGKLLSKISPALGTKIIKMKRRILG